MLLTYMNKYITIAINLDYLTNTLIKSIPSYKI